MDTQNQWPPLDTELLPWRRDPDDLALVPKSRRRRILPHYEAAVPLTISQRDLSIPHDLALRIEGLSAQLARFDAETAARGFNLPALLLRSESSSSSQIEHLTSSVRNVALAELSDRAPQNARLIADNVKAMRVALSTSGSITTSSLVEIQDTLMQGHGTGLRTEQVWIGGSPHGPHGALFVPPSWRRVPSCLDDLCAYLKRSDVSPLVKAAVAHAQFETIHPFVDGNGRTGRAMLHLVLRNEGLLEHSMLPVSAGLLHDVDTYMDSLDRYHDGDPVAVVYAITNALAIALELGRRATRDIEQVLDGWDALITERKGSAIHRLPTILVEQPVVNVAYVSEQLGITTRAANNLVARAEELRILRRVGTARRGVFYQADELVDVLESIANVPSTKRRDPHVP